MEMKRRLAGVRDACSVAGDASSADKYDLAGGRAETLRLLGESMAGRCRESEAPGCV